MNRRAHLKFKAVLKLKNNTISLISIRQSYGQVTFVTQVYISALRVELCYVEIKDHLSQGERDQFDQCFYKLGNSYSYLVSYTEEIGF